MRFLVELMKTLVMIVFLVATGCTVHTPTESPDSVMTTLPAVVNCFLSACDVVLADRDTRAIASAVEDVLVQEAEQEATATPTVEIPLAP